jgi:hypothetical protein
MPISKSITALLLTFIILTSSLLIFRAEFKNKPTCPPVAKHVQEAKQDLSSSKNEARTAEFKILHRTRLKDLPAIKVGSVITSETLELLQARDRDALDAVCKLDLALDKADIVIKCQDIEITQLQHKVIMWKVISGVIVIIAIVIII